MFFDSLLWILLKTVSAQCLKAIVSTAWEPSSVYIIEPSFSFNNSMLPKTEIRSDQTQQISRKDILTERNTCVNILYPQFMER